jgi:hypothetical protein
VSLSAHAFEVTRIFRQRFLAREWAIALGRCSDGSLRRHGNKKKQQKNEFDCCDFSHSAARPSLKITGERELAGSVVLADRHKWFRSAFSETDRISREQRRTVDESFFVRSAVQTLSPVCA